MAEEMAGKHSSRKLAQRRLLRAATGGVAALLVCAASASAKSYVPPSHKIFHGVSDTTDNADFYRFAQRVRAHPAVLEDFYHWDTPLTTGALDRWAATRTRGVLSLSTAPGGEAERISPRAVAQGRGDRYILRLNQSIAASKQVVYIRLFPEMNGYWNPYSAFNESGSSRGRSHSTSSFRQAWQRVVLIMRGGKLREINRELRERGMPRLLRAESSQDPVYETESVHGGRLARPKVAFIWNPQTIASPNVPGNQPGYYWPGKRFVDWVAADIYSAFGTPGVWAAFEQFYRKWRGFPFAVGEYSPWNNDYKAHFTRKLFRWVERHGRARMLIYYRSVNPDTTFDVNYWPRARKVIRHQLNKKRFVPYASGLAPNHHRRHHQRLQRHR